MDFSKNFLLRKEFEFEEGIKATLKYAFAHQEFCRKRQEILDTDAPLAEKEEGIFSLVGEYLIDDFSGVVYNGFPVKFSRKNAINLMKNNIFKGLIGSKVFKESEFVENLDLDLDIDEIEKN